MGWKAVNSNNVIELENLIMEPGFAWLAGFPLLLQYYFFVRLFLLKLPSSPAPTLVDSIAGCEPRHCFFYSQTSAH